MGKSAHIRARRRRRARLSGRLESELETRRAARVALSMESKDKFFGVRASALAERISARLKHPIVKKAPRP